MPRCAAAARTNALPTTARGPSLYAVSGVNPVVREVGLANTSTSSVVVGLARATTTGTQGSGLTEVCESDSAYSPLATAFQTHTADATLGAVFRQFILPGLGGIIWTFYDQGLRIPSGTSNGLVVVCPTGTAQHLDFYFVWDE